VFPDSQRLDRRFIRLLYECLFDTMRLSTLVYKLGQTIENLEYRLTNDEVQLAEYANTGRQLPSPEMMH